MPPTEPRPLRIALVSSEVAPFAKTGGLADVVPALARALHRRGHDVRVFLPCYGKLREGGLELTETLKPFPLELPGRTYSLGVRSAPLPHAEDDGRGLLAAELLDCPALYHRDAYYTSDPDEHLRWAALSRGVLEVCQRTGWAPDVIHCNDWHAGLLPLYLQTWYAWDNLFAGTKTLFSIHNLAYRGEFPAAVIEELGLGDQRGLLHQQHLDEGRIGFLETGLMYASWLSTVSETYAREIQTPEHGMGLEGLLQQRADHLTGIVNGVDSVEWNPSVDALIPNRYGPGNLAGKKRCKQALLKRMNLAPSSDGPGKPGPLVLGIVSRMTAQKGFDLLPDVLPVLLQKEDVRLVVLGSGEERHERYFQWLRDTFPHKVGCFLGFQNELAHQIEAGCDLFLMPSRFEPCGLNQMYSLAYGAVPLVRHTGGLADTVERWDSERRTGTGFVFYDFSPDALLHALQHALEVWRDRDAWAALVQNGMEKDFSWERQSERYVDLYRHVLTT